MRDKASNIGGPAPQRRARMQGTSSNTASEGAGEENGEVDESRNCTIGVGRGGWGVERYHAPSGGMQRRAAYRQQCVSVKCGQTLRRQAQPAEFMGAVNKRGREPTAVVHVSGH